MHWLVGDRREAFVAALCCDVPDVRGLQVVRWFGEFVCAQSLIAERIGVLAIGAIANLVNRARVCLLLRSGEQPSDC